MTSQTRSPFPTLSASWLGYSRFRFFCALFVCCLCANSSLTQTLTVSGSCPGQATMDVTGAEPNSQVVLLSGSDSGADLAPGGSCAGTELGLTGDLAARATLTANGAGEVSFAASLPAGSCGSWLQALVVDTCSTSNAAPINFSEPNSIEVSCEPTPNPLRFGCEVTVDPPQPVEVRYSRSDGLGVERANRSDLVADAHGLPVLFLAPQVEYVIEATALNHPLGLTATDNFTTGVPPFDIDSWLTVEGESTIGLVGGELPCSEAAVAVIYDTGTGDLVWYEEIDPNGSFGPVNMVNFTPEQTVLGETGDRVVEVDLTGQVLTLFGLDYPAPHKLHHDIFKANGNYYSVYQDNNDGLILDPVVIIDSLGNELFEWHPADHLPIPPLATGDWLHNNTMWVEEDGTVLLSWLTRDSVAKIDLNPSSPTFGDVLWVMDGDPPDILPSDITIDWSGIEGADFFSRQHNFSRRRDGRYMLLDNEHGRGIIFTIDEVNRTATADGVYQTTDPACGAQGTATETGVGNVLVACWTEFLREYDVATNEIAWEAEAHCANGGIDFIGSVRWYSLHEWSEAFLAEP